MGAEPLFPLEETSYYMGRINEKSVVDLSVIIPVYNAMPLLERCLDSVFGQTTRYAVEVILVDDGSTDTSVDYIRSRKEPNLVLHRQANAGPAAARNKGVELAQSRYCAYLDADDYWMDGYVEQTVTFLDVHADCVAVTVGQRHRTVSGETIAPSCIGEFTAPVVLGDFFDFWAAYMHVCTGSVTIRRDAIQETGGQRQDLRITEDLEFWALLGSYGNWGLIPKIMFTSDGTDLASNRRQWLAKMERRWRNAPSVGEWEHRVVARLPQPLPEGYLKARGRIARNLVYCQLLSGRESLARQEALAYGDYFTRDAIGRLMRLARKNALLWYGLCRFLRYREYHRF